MLTYVLVALALIVILLLAIIAMRPSAFHIERSIEIQAAPGAVFPHVNDLRKSHAWSPWVALDPQAQYSFEGPPAGVNAIGRWSGGKNVGEGSQTIVESRPDELVVMRLEFMKPFESTSTAEFRLSPGSGRTRVTWGLSGRNKFLFKAITLFMNQDRMIGSQFEKGLAKLKAIAEGAST